MLISDEQVYLLAMALTLALDGYNLRVGNQSLPPATRNALQFTFGTICINTEIGTDFLAKAERWHADHPDMQSKILRELEKEGHSTSNLIDLNGRRLGG